MPALILAPDFGIEPKPTPVLLRRGGTTFIRVDTHTLRGMTEAIHLSLEGAPLGLVHQFDPPDVLPGQSSTLTISDTALLQPGDYVAQIRGVSTLGVRTAALPITCHVNARALFAAGDQPRAAALLRRGEQRWLRGNQGLDLPDNRQHGRLYNGPSVWWDPLRPFRAASRPGSSRYCSLLTPLG